MAVGVGIVDMEFVLPCRWGRVLVAAGYRLSAKHLNWAGGN